MRVIAATLAVAVLLGLVGVSGASAQVTGVVPAPGCDARAASTGGQPVALPGCRPGLVVSDGVVGAVAPVPGQGVDAAILTTTGSRLLHVETTPAGQVLASSIFASAAGAREAAQPACSDPAYQLLGYKERGTYRYFTNVSTQRPSNYSAAEAVAAFTAGASGITSARNDCGLGDNASASASRAGNTSRQPDILGAVCQPRDGTSVMGFGALGPGTLAGTCSYTMGAAGPDELVEADVEVNSAQFRFTNSVGSGCRSTHHLPGVMTHEVGHVFGLGHVSEGAHGRLTMSTNIGACDASAATLGLGDVRALAARY